MASTISITFETQVLDFNPLVRGEVNVKFSVGGQTHDLKEVLVTSVPQSKQFQEVITLSPSQADNDQQAANFVNAFKRDYANIGGGKNLTPSRVGNVVTITAKEGTFPSGSGYTGNTLTVTFGAPNNQTPVSTPVLSALGTLTGTCDIVEYSLSVTGGSSPYKVTSNGAEIITGWTGTAQNIALARGKVAKLFVTDNAGNLSASVTVIPARKLVASEFSEKVIVGIGSSDLTISNDNPVNGTLPLQYSLDAITATSGTAYQTSNSFPGILPNSYKLFIKDKYGCAVSKTIIVSALQDPTTENDIRYFLISDFNSLSFSKQDGARKHYLNTLSFEESVGIQKQALFNFTAGDSIKTQFKSSYPYHNITLFKCDGTKESLPFVQIQENLGAVEKVDCELIPVTGGIGVYFDGGNSYTPGTNTIETVSPYGGGLPSWAKKGQFATIDTLGTKIITGEGYDADLNKMYFTVDGTIGAALSSKVQVTYNRHPYNVYRVDFPMSKVSNKAFIRIEAGLEFDEIDQVWQSETIKLLTDTTNFIKMEWSAYKNLENMIFVDGYTGVMWVKGKVRPYAISEAKTYDGSDETYPLIQSARMGQRVEIPLMTAKQWHKFNLVSGITIAGTLIIEDMELVRVSPIEVDEIGQTNYSNVSCEFAYTGEGLQIQADEIVLNVSTGVVGGGGTGKEGVVGWQGYKRILLADGSYLRLSNGSFVALN